MSRRSSSAERDFRFPVDPELKAAFTAAAEAEHRPADQLLRDFMRAYVRRQHAAEAGRQSRAIAASAADPLSDEADVMRWIEEVSDREGWVA